MATRTPAARASLAADFQYGVTRSFHCQASILANSGGQGATIHAGCALLASAGGQPLKVITVETSRRRASSSVRLNV